MDDRLSRHGRGEVHYTKSRLPVVAAHHSAFSEKHSAYIDKGWHYHYWNPWKQHLAGKTITRPKM